MSFEASLATRLLLETDTMSVPVDLKTLAEKNDIIVQEDNSSGYAGMLLVVNDLAMISVKKSIRENSRKRFTIAHEIGHYVLPGHISKENTMFQCTDEHLNSFGRNKTKEVEANVFASELLMPDQLFSPRVSGKDISKKLVKELTDEFQTSLSATCIKLINCKDDYSLVCSVDSRVKWFCRGAQFPYYLNANPGTPVHQDSFAYHFFETTKTHENFYEVPTESWIDDEKGNNSTTLKEMVIGIPSYSMALSFLYLEKSEGEDFADDRVEYQELDGYPKFRR
jgi:Zn-dependent peptidase ImmA (M78 family)